MTRAEIVNLTREAVLHTDPEWALSRWKQALGFIGRRPGRNAIVMLFMPARRERIHMFFVRGPIDLVALDGQGRVIALRERLRPWQQWTPDVRMSALLELPEGTIARTRTQLDDRVQLPQPPL